MHAKDPGHCQPLVLVVTLVIASLCQTLAGSERAPRSPADHGVTAIVIAEADGAKQKEQKLYTAEPSSGESALLAGQSVDTTATASTYPDPNRIPYRTHTSPLRYMLSIPAKVWHLVYYPLGATTIWVEQKHIHDKVIHFFLNDDLTGGIIPIIDIGGSMGFAPGVMTFHNNLFNKGKSVNLTFLFGSEDDNDASLTYFDRSAFGSPIQISLLTRFFSDSDENYFPGRNRSALDDITSYDIEKGTMEVGVACPLSTWMAWQLHAGFTYGDVNRGDGRRGEKFPVDIAGFGTSRLGAFGSSVTIDFRDNWPRTTSGPLINLKYLYSTELSDDRFLFHYYSAELQQFLDVPFLAQNRRLCLRTRLEKREEITDKEIPFYELSMLGDADNLRGYDQNRFLAQGSFLVNVEYRYPIWDTWDAVIFLDQGQVFDAFREISLKNLHGSGGAGLRFMTGTGFLFRAEVSFSKETTRALFRLTPNF